MNVNDTILQATDPQRDASVHASAGTGKTWLLVTRVLRLLLAGARPDGILAITFTRKAAAEMEQRIMQRLRELACAEPEPLRAMLQQAGVEPDADALQRAPRLYEELLCNPWRLRSTTFHSLCQELLQRFPLEAGVSPGFEVTEKTGQLEQAAHDALLAITARHPDDPVSRALDVLVEGCGGLDSAHRALRAFMAQRSDWWAWTQAEADRQAFACRQLAGFLGIDPTRDPLAGFPDERQREQHRTFAELLRDNTPGDAAHAARIEDALAQELTGRRYMDAVVLAWLTRENTPRKRKSTPTLQKRLGPGRAARFLSLHEAGCDELLALRDALARHHSYTTNAAWYRAGEALLKHYQRIKREQRVFDFTDLECLACELLNHGEHAGWVQYKLDARIDHLLVDEFQDTNPTQWRMLRPLLDELAAGDDGRQRSVFLVGDRKQSIYGFRRANPALLETAANWLEEHRNGRRYPLNRSRRSAQAVMDCVNRVFSQPDMGGLLADFVPHETHLPDMFGHVELLPLSCAADDGGQADPVATTLRNPLHTPRILAEDLRYRHEGEQIAARIRQLIDSGATHEKDGTLRPVGYGDILVLLRSRTHAGACEQALRDAGIPCLGTSRGLLLENLEVRDLVALLNTLISPYDNLALAQVLRSPLFGLDSEQLLPLCEDEGAHHWYARLQQLAVTGQSPWHETFELLQHWRELAGQLPVHDLLDRIFHEGEVLQRYEAAFPPALLPRVRASLTRFIELALEIDNGRYPSLPRFLDLLNRLRQSEQDQPDESAPEDGGDERVRLLTIHAAKGLEAPVVFLADSARCPQDRSAWNAIVDWPDNAERPELLLLAATKELRDDRTGALLQRQAMDSRREDANLLYVALTRARQYLFISGSCKPGAGDTAWYGLLEQALQDCERNADGNLFIESGTRRQPGEPADGQPPTVAVAAGLSQPVPITLPWLQIAPSRHALSLQGGHGGEDGRERGIALHAMLDLLTREQDAERDTLYHHVAGQLQRAIDDEELQAWWREALAITTDPALAAVFDSGYFEQAFNEVPVQYLDGPHMVYGVIDRLVVHADTVLLIDYKTHRHADAQTLPQLVEEYLPQLRYYMTAVTRLWPQHRVRAGLLFTACAELVWPDALQCPAGTP